MYNFGLHENSQRFVKGENQAVLEADPPTGYCFCFSWAHGFWRVHSTATHNRNTDSSNDYGGMLTYLEVTANEISDAMLKEILDFTSEITVTIHIKAINQVKAIKKSKQILVDLEREKMTEQQKALKGGYDPEMLPSGLILDLEQATSLLDELQSRNERMFLVTFLFMNIAQTREALENDIEHPDELAMSMPSLLSFVMEDGEMPCKSEFIHRTDQMDIIPGGIELKNIRHSPANIIEY